MSNYEINPNFNFVFFIFLYVIIKGISHGVCCGNIHGKVTDFPLTVVTKG